MRAPIQPIQIILLMISCVFHSGCATTADFSHAVVNSRMDISEIRPGMSSEEIKGLLRDKVITGYEITRGQVLEIRPAHLKNPFRSEIFRNGNKVFEVIYSYAQVRKQDGIVSDDELLPLVFENDRLVGQGWQFWELCKRENRF